MSVGGKMLKKKKEKKRRKKKKGGRAGFVYLARPRTWNAVSPPHFVVVVVFFVLFWGGVVAMSGFFPFLSFSRWIQDGLLVSRHRRVLWPSRCFYRLSSFARPGERVVEIPPSGERGKAGWERI